MLFYTHQFFLTELNVGGGIDATQTTGIVAQSVAGVDITKPGIACISYSDPIVTSTAEWFTYTSIDGSNEFQGVARGQEGFGAKNHAPNAIIAFPFSESHINNLNDMFTTGGGGYTQIATPANPASGYNKLYFKADGSPYILNSAGAESRLSTAVPRVVSAASYTTDTGTALSVDTCDKFVITAQAGPLKFNNPGGTVAEGSKLRIRIEDNGTAQALTYDTQFRASSDLDLPSTTVLGKVLEMGFEWDATDSKWTLMALLNNI